MVQLLTITKLSKRGVSSRLTKVEIFKRETARGARDSKLFPRYSLSRLWVMANNMTEWIGRRQKRKKKVGPELRSLWSGAFALRGLPRLATNH